MVLPHSPPLSSGCRDPGGRLSCWAFLSAEDGQAPWPQLQGQTSPECSSFHSRPNWLVHVAFAQGLLCSFYWLALWFLPFLSLLLGSFDSCFGSQTRPWLLTAVLKDLGAARWVCGPGLHSLCAVTSRWSGWARGLCSCSLLAAASHGYGCGCEPSVA